MYVSRECQETPTTLLHSFRGRLFVGWWEGSCTWEFAYGQLPFPALNIDTIFNIRVWFFTHPLAFQPYTCYGGRPLHQASPDSSRKEYSRTAPQSTPGSEDERSNPITTEENQLSPDTQPRQRAQASAN